MCERGLFVEIDELDAAVVVSNIDCTVRRVQRQTKGS